MFNYALFFFCTGIMAARGMLANPAMFAGYQNTPEQCVKDWVSHIFKKKKKNFLF